VSSVRPNRLQNALAMLGEAMREVNSAIEEMRAEHDPLAWHIFASRRLYRNVRDTKATRGRKDFGQFRRSERRKSWGTEGTTSLP